MPFVFSPRIRCSLVGLLLPLLHACGGGDGESPAGAAAATTLVRLQAEAAGTNCTGGGSQVLAGLDANGNGLLDAAEVASTQYVCANGMGGGAVRTTLVGLAIEPAGAHCAAGGTRIGAGFDTDGDGVLGMSEATAVAYVCGGAPGVAGAAGAAGSNGLATLMAMAAEPAGANCTWGGSRITMGVDGNRNGMLDAGEIGSTQFVCHGAGLAWVGTSDAAVQTVVNTGYVAQGAGPSVFTLPAASAIGAVVRIVGGGVGGWTLAQQAGQTIATGSIATTVPGAVWTPRGGAADWRGIASSSDGARLVAVANLGRIHTSSDGGATWTERESVRQWWSVASSADGKRLAATTLADRIFVSDDFGETWAPRDAPHDWSSIAMSSDGMRMVAGELNGSLYTSDDGGASWTPNGPFAYHVDVASSADGTTLAAAAWNGQIHVSTDAGANWTARETARAWMTVAVSADGRRMVAGVQGGMLYVSVDGGITWTSRATVQDWTDLAMSADGRRVVASTFGGTLHVSNDGGATWAARDGVRSWNAVASSADGSRIAAAAYFSDRLYTSSASTSLGVAGSISGLQDDAVDVQYVGNGRYVVTGHSGALTVR